MLLRSDMSLMRRLSERLASVETFLVWWAFYTSECYAHHNYSATYGELSL
jgi:hypothetical protein